MKKIIKCLSLIFTAALLLVSVVESYSAATIYTVDGYSFSINDDNTLSLCDWDNRTSDLIVPNTIADRFVTDIAMFSFQKNEVITSVDFTQASRLNRISTYAFEGCTSLNDTLYLPYNIVFLGNAAFMNCTSITELDYRAKTDSIPEQCFRNCSSLKNVTIESGPTSIETNAFRNCASLESVLIPKSITSISNSAFRESPNVTIRCYNNSYAHLFARENNIPYILMDRFLLGDVDGDGAVNVSDVTTIQRYLAELENIEGIYLHAADANQDGTVDISDATALQMYIAEYDLPYPIGEVITQ